VSLNLLTTKTKLLSLTYTSIHEPFYAKYTKKKHHIATTIGLSRHLRVNLLLCASQWWLNMCTGEPCLWITPYYVRWYLSKIDCQLDLNFFFFFLTQMNCQLDQTSHNLVDWRIINSLHSNLIYTLRASPMENWKIMGQHKWEMYPTSTFLICVVDPFTVLDWWYSKTQKILWHVFAIWHMEVVQSNTYI